MSLSFTVILVLIFRTTLSIVRNSSSEFISSNLADVHFYVYSNNYRNAFDYKELKPWDLDSLEDVNFTQGFPLKVLTHGFMSNSTDDDGFVQRIKNAYLATRTTANLLVMDWSPLSTVRDRLPLLPYYFKAVRNVQIVGEYLAEMLTFLLQQNVTVAEEIHLIGFSLGAHVSGIAGYHFVQNTSKPIGRITGLDPAGPAFQNKNAMGRLDASDATFVDVVHTNQGKNGYKGAIGHVDFYPNAGGPQQPGCKNITSPDKFLTGLCAHQFAYKLYEKSIYQPYNITACRCESMLTLPCKIYDKREHCKNRTFFGENCPSSVRGEYFMEVRVDEETGILTILDYNRRQNRKGRWWSLKQNLNT